MWLCARAFVYIKYTYHCGMETKHGEVECRNDKSIYISAGVFMYWFVCSICVLGVCDCVFDLCVWSVCLCGCVVVWLCGCVLVCLCGCVLAWLCIGLLECWSVAVLE